MLIRAAMTIAFMFTVSAGAAERSAFLGGREEVDTSVPPYSAIGQVNTAAYGRCTGVLIGRATVVTAAHCLYNRATRRIIGPRSVHVVLGYVRGTFLFHSIAREISIGPGYDGAAPQASIGSDWALLTLEDAAPDKIPVIAIAEGPPQAGRAFISLGFSQDRPYVLTKTPPCGIEGLHGAGLVIGHCDVPKGFSGGPMIDAQSGRLLAIQVAHFERDGVDRVIGLLPIVWQETTSRGAIPISAPAP